MVSLQSYAYDVSAVGPTLIVSPWNSNKMRIWALFMWNLTAQTIDFCQQSNQTLSGYMDSFPAKSGKLMQMGPRPYWELDSGSGLYLRTENGTRVTGFVTCSAPSDSDRQREDLVVASDVSLSVTNTGGSASGGMAFDYTALGNAIAAALRGQMDTLALILQQGFAGR